PLQTMEKLEISKKIKVFAIFGTIVACLLIAEEVIAKYRKIRLGLWGLSVVVMLGSIAMYRVRVEQFYALLATVAFATLSVVYLMKRVRYYLHRQTEKSCCYKSLLKAAAELLVCIVISLAGAVFVVVLYGSSNYLFEFSKFVGVKASQMMPLLLTILLYFSVIGMNGAYRPEETPWSQVRDVLQRNVKVWQMLLLAGVAGILAIMTLRSGHTSNIEPPSFELWFRNLLELITPARPRTKAIFLGFPALLILIVLADKKYFRSSYILFLLAATIGQANILNSFSHIRTPLLVSLYRVMGEYVVSLLFALIFVVLFDLAERVYREVRKRMGVNA
ncbi:MAG: DUF5693 family protein, partial [Bacillota bacterium]|nr:DUF5693 family protein [Bacillota bacterium]